jgi:hypothetical protein
VRVDTTSCAVVTSSFGHSDANLYIPPLQSARRLGEPPISFEPTLRSFPSYVPFDFHLSKHVNNVPDQRIDVVIECGLRIESATGALQTTGSSIQGKVSEPWVLDLVPVVGLIVSIDTGEARAKLSMQFQPLTDDLPGLVN